MRHDGSDAIDATLDMLPISSILTPFIYCKENKILLILFSIKHSNHTLIVMK